MLTWTRPTAKPDYWEGDHGFWITTKQVRDYKTGYSYTAWQLFNGENELGTYDALDEAKAAAEPEYTEAWSVDVTNDQD